MLDERHPDLLARPNDDNSYILGRIYGHNVAIACLPAGVYGTTAATKVATQMLSTFTSVRFCLMVGIGGGVPSERNDIRLGDVVVSKPTRDSGGVIQYDYGKTVTGGRFERTGILNKPPAVLLTAVSRLQAEHALQPSRTAALLLDAVARNPRMRGEFAYRGEDQDLLFDSEYDHPDPGNTCNKCDTRRLVTRPARTSHDPVFHYGLIASGNQVMKDGRSRDNLARGLDILCFEMEAAGLMDNFPCLVIRGICDYSDSHKTKQWQGYAAATAAAYSKELLSVVLASHVVDTLPVGSVTDGMLSKSYCETYLSNETLVSYYRGAPPSMVNCPRSEIVLKGECINSLQEVATDGL
jgi:nucleoside phosphorylase